MTTSLQRIGILFEIESKRYEKFIRTATDMASDHNPVLAEFTL